MVIERCTWKFFRASRHDTLQTGVLVLNEFFVGDAAGGRTQARGAGRSTKPLPNLETASDDSNSLSSEMKNESQ